MSEFEQIKFQNSTRPESTFDLVKLEDLLSRKIDHDITAPHKISFFSILIITKGSGYHTIDFTDHQYKRGTLMTIRKDQIQRFFRSSNAQGYILLFTEDFLSSQFDKTEVLRAFQLFNELLTAPKLELSKPEFKEIVDLVKRIEAEYNERDDEFSIGIIRSALHILVIKLFRIKAEEGDKLVRSKYLDEFLHFQQLIEAHCFQTKKVLDYARMMNCTSKTLNNICRSILDKSAKACIDDIVTSQIKRLLINTKLPIKEIAYQTGFEETTNFYKYFKRQAQTTPEQFRANH